MSSPAAADRQASLPETDGGQLARIAKDSVIAQFYGQF